MAVSASPVLADSVGPGGTAAIVVFILILACIGIFVAFLGSQKRLRRNVTSGVFHTQDRRPPKDATDQTKTAEAKDPVSPDPGDRPGAGA